MKGLKNSITCLLIIISFNCFGQNDSLPYTLYKDKLVLYTDLGYSSAPFSVLYSFPEGLDKIKFKNNFRTILGLGVCYKWFALRIGVPLPGYFRPISRFGKTVPINLGIDFTIKKTFCDVDFRLYDGSALKNAYRWNDTLNNLHPHDIRPKSRSASFSINAWYFHDKNYKMSVVRGKTGEYNREVKTWYIKSTFNAFGVGNDKGSLIPTDLIDTLNSKTSSSIYTAFDLGAVPGYAYVNKINNWQFSILGGIGGVIQLKYYAVNGGVRANLGLAPRYDIRLVGGYSIPRYFVFLVTDFDNKSIRFNNLIMRQSFYNIKIVAGMRFVSDKEEKRKKKI